MTLCNRLLILGLGVIGGSVALAAKHYALAREVTGFAQAEDCQAALRSQAVDRVCSSDAELAVAIEAADFVVLALPVKIVIERLPLVAKHLQSNAILMDACSVKSVVWEKIQATLGERSQQYVGAHPIAGSHLSGFSGARADLFQGALVTLGPGTPPLLKRAEIFWESLGARTSAMSPQDHDALYAQVSHLPHLVAFGLVNALAEYAKQHGAAAAQALPGQLGKGFLDSTRIAASSPDLWTDISLSNRSALLASLDIFEQQITLLKAAITNSDEVSLKALLHSASEFRRTLER
jgi:prephenate dehydrogenase